MGTSKAKLVFDSFYFVVSELFLNYLILHSKQLQAILVYVFIKIQVFINSIFSFISALESQLSPDFERA